MGCLAVCCIAKDEEPYFPEWIEYHRLVGVEHFYVYDNDSARPLREALADDIGRGLVTVIDFPGTGLQQERAYTHCLSSFRHAFEWIAFIDLDEFLFPVNAGDMREVLAGFEGRGAMGLNWMMFGSSGHVKKPAGLQIDEFTMRAAEPNAHIKSVVRADRGVAAINGHCFSFRDGFYCVNEAGARVDGPFSSPPSALSARINHYAVRSKEEFDARMAKRTVNAVARHPDTFRNAEAEFSSVRDESMARFSSKLKAALEARARRGVAPAPAAAPAPAEPPSPPIPPTPASPPRRGHFSAAALSGAGAARGYTLSRRPPSGR